MSSKPVMKGSRVESIEQARKEYKQLLDEGWKKTKIKLLTKKGLKQFSKILKKNL